MAFTSARLWCIVLKSALVCTSPNVSQNVLSLNFCKRVGQRVEHCFGFHFAMCVVKSPGLYSLLPLLPASDHGNTLGLYLRKRVSLEMDKCYSFKFIYCGDICVSFQSCINVTVCFDRCLGLHTRYCFWKNILATTSDSVLGNVSTNVSLHSVLLTVLANK